jgi:hypothetical protein
MVNWRGAGDGHLIDWYSTNTYIADVPALNLGHATFIEISVFRRFLQSLQTNARTKLLERQISIEREMT